MTKDIEEIDNWLSTLNCYIAKKTNGDGTEYRSVPISVCDNTIWLEFFIDSSFPFSQIQVYTKPEYRILEYPHVEASGKLCLPNVPGSGLEKFQATFNFARSLVFRIETKDTTLFDDFKKEFNSYWGPFCDFCENPREIWYILDSPRCFSSFENLYQGKWKRKILFSTAIDSIKSAEPECRNIKRGACLIKVRSLPLPREYPKTIGQLFNYLKKEGMEHDCVDTLKKNLCYDENNIIMCSSENVLFGVRYLPEHINRKKCRKRFQNSCEGKVIPFRVKRMDRNWIFGRDQNKDLDKLFDKTVVIIGCGAIGSFLAVNLVKAGISKLILIDDDFLDYPNISRHVLGMDYILKNKAEGLKEYLEKSFPDVRIETAVGRFNKVYNEVYKEKINNVSLIISATADKEAEEQLNHLQVTGTISSPIIYGWTTKNCVSGHGIAILDTQQSCLKCLLDHEFINPVLQNEESYQEPACGAEFVPYGIVELSFVNAMLSQLALDVLLGKIKNNIYRIWISSKEHIETCNGNINKDWEKRYGPIGDGGRIMSVPIIQKGDCKICHRKG